MLVIGIIYWLWDRILLTCVFLSALDAMLISFSLAMLA